MYATSACEVRALHEAAHAVCAILMGVRIDVLFIGDHQAFADVESEPNPYDVERVERYLVVYFAGEPADIRACGHRVGARNDYNRAHQLREKTRQGHTSLVPMSRFNAIDKFTDDVVSQYWRVIEAVAAALLASTDVPADLNKKRATYLGANPRVLDGPKVLEIVRAHLTGVALPLDLPPRRLNTESRGSAW
jgi:hypothetical protein